MDSAPRANNEAASSSKDAEIITSLPAAEDTYVHSQLYIIAAIKSDVKPFKDNAIKLDSILTPKKNTILHINIMSRNRSSMETASTKFVKDILDICPSLLLLVNVNAETPLHVAAKYGHSDIVEILIESSAKHQHEELESGIGAVKRMLRMTNKEGDTALHEAVRYDHLDVVQILTKKDPHFTYSSNKRDETPLYIAAAANDFALHSVEIVVNILKTCTSPAYEGPNQMTALHAAAMNFRPDITIEILKKKRSLTKERDQHGWTPLHYAAYYQRHGSMKAILIYDISTAFIGDKHRNMTPLHIAIGQGYIPNEIISSCPDCCELVDERRWNVLHFAVLSLTYKDLKFVLKHPLIKNLINDMDADGNTPLHLLDTFRSRLFFWKIERDFGVVKKETISVCEELKSRYDQLKKEIPKLEESVGPYQRGVVSVKGSVGESDEKYKKEIEETKNSHLIVAALIATVTFTAAFTLPGGVIQEGDNEGTAILSKNSAFQAFVITDAIAMVLSLSAVFAHFLMSQEAIISSQQSWFLLTYGGLSTMVAMVAMVIAFVTGTFAVLTTSLWLSILTTVIGLFFFIFMLIVFKGMMWANENF